MDIDKALGVRFLREGSKSSPGKKTKKVGSSRFASTVPVATDNSEQELGDVEGSGGPGTAVGITGLDALLAVQEVTYRNESVQEDVLWGENMLSHLETLRNALLMGKIGKRDLQMMLEMVQHKKRRSVDEHLHSILNEIELRARVELAKLGMDHPK